MLTRGDNGLTFQKKITLTCVEVYLLCFALLPQFPMALLQAPFVLCFLASVNAAPGSQVVVVTGASGRTGSLIYEQLKSKPGEIILPLMQRHNGVY